MRSARTISKVTPINVTPTGQNEITPKESNIINQIQYLILFEGALGINRIYLLRLSKLKTIIFIIYCLLLICFSIYFMFHSAKLGTTHYVVKNTLIIEYVALIIFVVSSVKVKLLKFFENISQFDKVLNIQDDLSITSSSRSNIIALVVCVFYNAYECYLEMNIYYDGAITIDQFYMLIVSLTHDVEQIFFYTLLRFTVIRLLILKAHIVKIFNQDNKVVNNLNKIEALSNKVNADISTLHRVYELLHRCSSQLNDVMSASMLVIFITSGISTIMFLKLFVNIIFQMSPSNKTQQSTILYVILRCLKYTMLLVIPCYYSSVTNTHASFIRTTLHDAINTMPLGKSDRRKVKTFFYLTRESEFSYALCGVIKLNMTLPLSYMSLCTTYLVIIIQFSKFLD